jgi:hypothetical protein
MVNNEPTTVAAVRMSDKLTTPTTYYMYNGVTIQPQAAISDDNPNAKIVELTSNTASDKKKNMSLSALPGDIFYKAKDSDASSPEKPVELEIPVVQEVEIKTQAEVLTKPLSTPQPVTTWKRQSAHHIQTDATTSSPATANLTDNKSNASSSPVIAKELHSIR